MPHRPQYPASPLNNSPPTAERHVPIQGTPTVCTSYTREISTASLAAASLAAASVATPSEMSPQSSVASFSCGRCVQIFASRIVFKIRGQTSSSRRYLPLESQIYCQQYSLDWRIFCKKLSNTKLYAKDKGAIGYLMKKPRFIGVFVVGCV